MSVGVSDSTTEGVSVAAGFVSVGGTVFVAVAVGGTGVLDGVNVKVGVIVGGGVLV